MKVLRQRYDRCGGTSDSVEDGHHLRHTRHGDGPRGGDGHQCAEPHRRTDHPVMAGRLDKESHQYGDDHSGNPYQVAVPGCARRAQRFERQDEANGGQEVDGR